MVLGQTSGLLTVHHDVVVVRGAGIHVFDESDAERTATVLVTAELGCGMVSVGLGGMRALWGRRSDQLTNSGVSGIGGVKLNDTGAAGTAVGLILNLRALNFADGSEQINQVIVTCGPRELCTS